MFQAQEILYEYYFLVLRPMFPHRERRVDKKLKGLNGMHFE